MDISYTTKAGEDVGILKAASLDVAIGVDENDFELVCDAQGGYELQEGSRVYVYGTEYGGIVDAYAYSSKDATITYTGRTIHGVLAQKVLEPDTGQDYLKVSGEIHSVLSALIARVGMSSFIDVDVSSTGVWVNYQFNRYISAWDGICSMLAESAYRPHFEWLGNKVVLRAEKIVSHVALDTDLIDHSFKHSFKPVNHLICLGKGELRDRYVVHLYADAKGRVSQRQSLFGLDEVSATYDYNNAENDELLQEGIKKLKELQDASSIEISLDSDEDYGLFDIVSSYDAATDTEVTAQINKKIVSIVGDTFSVDYKVGGKASSTSLSSSGGSNSSGGVAYTAGAGIKIENATISAEVTQAKLDTVETLAQSAKQDASNAESSAGEALAKVTKRIASINGSTQIDVATADSGDGLVSTITHAESGVTPGTYGVASAYQYPTFGGSASFPQSVTVDAQGHVTSIQKGSVRIPSSTATQSTSGLMSASDKAKLDSVDTGANAYTLPPASTYALGGVKPDGKTITVSGDGTISAQAGGATAFLAAYPVGSVYTTSRRVNPSAQWGGTWREIDTMAGYQYERTS